jgi:hypothetical protein
MPLDGVLNRLSSDQKSMNTEELTLKRNALHLESKV